jgi:hypothetical protein
MTFRQTLLAAAITACVFLSACGGGDSGTAEAAGLPSPPQGGAAPIDQGTPVTQQPTQLSWSVATKLTASGATIYYPTAAIAADGFAATAYVAQQNGDNGRLYVALREPGTDSWAAPLAISPVGQKPVRVTPASGWASSSPANQLAVNPATGDATLVWASEADAAFPSGRSVWLARYSRSGKAWSAPERLGYASSMPAIATNRKGTTVLAWAAPGAGANTIIQGRVLASDGVTGFGGFDAGLSPSTPQVAIDGQGQLTLAWRSGRTSGVPPVAAAGSQLNLVRMTARNSSPTVQRLAEDTVGQLDFTLAGAESGAAVLGIATSAGQVYGSTRVAGSDAWTPFQALQGGVVNYLPAAAIGANGDALLMFSASDSPGDSYYQRTAWAVRFSAATGGWSTATQLSSATAGVGQPEAHLNDDGSALLSMRGTNVMTWRSSGEKWERTTHDLTGTAPVTAMDPASGRAVLVWVGDRVAVNQDGLMAQLLR